MKSREPSFSDTNLFRLPENPRLSAKKLLPPPCSMFWCLVYVLLIVKHDVGVQWKDKDKRTLQSREGQQQRSGILQSNSGRWLRFWLLAAEAARKPNKNVHTHEQMYVGAYMEILLRKYWK